jgi:hypothetical protein
MAKDKTGLYIGLGIVALGTLYFLTKKPTTTNPVVTPGVAPATSPTGLIAQGTGLLSAISKLFGGGSSTPAAPGTAAAFTPVSAAPIVTSTPSSISPAGQLNYINPSAPSIPIAAPAAPSDGGMAYDDSSSENEDITI